MRIHTSADRADLNAAARAAGVALDASEHGSRTHERAFEVRLADGRGRSWRNSGQHGAATWEGNAATWDEWGIFLAELYRGDSEARVGGSTRHPIYANADHFHDITGDRYRDLTPEGQHARHKWAYVGQLATGPHLSRCKCGATLRRAA
jgi:hypothetical protein